MILWEHPTVGQEYLLGCDPSLGRAAQSGDHSCIIIARRENPRRLVQVAEVYFRWPIGRVGEVISCLAREFCGDDNEPAMVHVERNLADSILVALRYQEFPEHRLFQGKRESDIDQAPSQDFFVQKTNKNSRLLVDTLYDYMDRDAFHIRSSDTLEEISSLERDDRGNVSTRGKDRVVAAMMVAIMDQDMPPFRGETMVVHAERECPSGVDEGQWRQMHGLPSRNAASPPSLPAISEWAPHDGLPVDLDGF